MVWINCGLDHCGLDQGWKSSRDDRFAEHYSLLWFGSRHEMLLRVRGNYYILQNSWLGSIVAWIIVVWIKGWKSPMDDRFAEHYSPLWFGSRNEMLSRVRGDYYILQNSWLGSSVVKIRHESSHLPVTHVALFRTGMKILFSWPVFTWLVFWDFQLHV